MKSTAEITQRWKEFMEGRKNALGLLLADEQLIRDMFERAGEPITQEWQDKIKRDRKTWVYEWGMEGTRSERIKLWQDEDTMLSVLPEYIDLGNGHYILRDTRWDYLLDDEWDE